MGIWAGFGEEWSNIQARRIKAMNNQAEKRHTWANSYGKKALDDLKGLSTEYQGYLAVLDDFGWSAKAQSGLLETGGLSKLKQISNKIEKATHLRADEIQALIKEAESWSTAEDGTVDSMSLVDKVNKAINLYKPSRETHDGIDKGSNMLAAILGYDVKSEYSDVNVGGYSYEDLRTLSVSDVDYGGTGARKFTNFRDAPAKPDDQEQIQKSLISRIIPNKIKTEYDILEKKLIVEKSKEYPDQALVQLLGSQKLRLENLNSVSNPVEKIQGYNAIFRKDMFFYEQLQSLDQGIAGGGILNNIYLPSVSKYLKDTYSVIENTGKSFATVEDYNEAKATGSIPPGPVMIAGRITYHGG